MEDKPDGIWDCLLSKSYSLLYRGRDAYLPPKKTYLRRIVLYLWDKDILQGNNMEKYKRPSRLVVCKMCSVEFEKELRDITRTKERNGVHCCTRKCSSAYVSKLAQSKSNKFNHYLINIRKSSRRKESPHTVTAEYLEEIWNNQDGKCAISSLSLIHAVQRTDRTMYQASVDRIDNSKGYVIGNVQFVSLAVNYMRNTFSIEEVRQFIMELAAKVANPV